MVIKNKMNQTQSTEDTDQIMAEISTTKPSNNASLRVSTTKLEFGSDSTDYESFKLQRDDLKRLVDMDKVRNLKCDESAFEERLKYLFSSCTCSHGARTAGCCGHTVAAIKYIHCLLNKIPITDPHPRSTLAASFITNLESQDETSESDVTDF